jgi:hypothetical protein
LISAVSIDLSSAWAKFSRAEHHLQTLDGEMPHTFRDAILKLLLAGTLPYAKLIKG